jgi:hypothetical protein
MGRLIDFNLHASDDALWRWEGGVYPDFFSCLLTAGAAGERKDQMP